MESIDTIFSRAKSRLAQWILDKQWLIPAMTSLMIVCTNILYPFAVQKGHVEAVLTYTSDAGTVYPAIFAQIIDTTAILMSLTGFIRYKQVDYYLKQIKLSPRLTHLQMYRLTNVNLVASLFVYCCSVGQIVAANFAADVWPIVHYTFVGIASVTFSSYACFMLYLAEHFAKFQLESPTTSLKIFTFLTVLTGVLCTVFSLVSLCLSEGQFFESQFRLHWKASQPAYWWHVGAVICDWSQMASFTMFTCCLTHRIKRFKEWRKVFGCTQ